MAVDKTTPAKDSHQASSVKSAWERWELPSIDEARPQKANALSSHRPALKVRSELTPEEAHQLKPLTADDLEAIRQSAYDEGYKQGQEAGEQAGYQAGYDSGASDLKAAITRLSQICRTLLEPIPEQDEALEQALLKLVESICKRILHAELKLDSSSLLQVVQEALDCLHPGAQRLKIHLNQQDMDLVAEQLKAMGEWEESWRIQAHPTITPGGCIVETEHSLVDSRAERRLATLIQQVYEQQQEAVSSKAQSDHMGQLIDEVERFDLENIHGFDSKS